MRKRGDKEWVSDVSEAIGRIERYVTHVSYKKFLKDVKTQDAVVRNLEIIGEAVKNISADFKKKHKYVEWRKIAGMRDKLIHSYFGVNLEIVWNAVKVKLPEFNGKIKKIIAERKQILQNAAKME